jgi:hypothetical protein
MNGKVAAPGLENRYTAVYFGDHAKHTDMSTVGPE